MRPLFFFVDSSPVKRTEDLFLFDVLVEGSKVPATPKGE